MLSSISTEEELVYVLPALMADAYMEKGKNADIVDIKPFAPGIAKEMEKLGYSELTPELLAGFIRIGDVQLIQKGTLRLFDGSAMNAFMGV